MVATLWTMRLSSRRIEIDVVMREDVGSDCWSRSEDGGKLEGLGCCC